jgi:hypothetical protein
MRKLTTLLLPLLLAGCVQGSSPPNATATTTAMPTPYYNVATGATDLVLRIDTGGGLVPVSYLVAHMPQFSLYGDGRIVVPGPTIEIYPQPLLPNLRIMRITPSEIQTILAAADKAGLLAPNADYPAGGIADAPTTVFTVTVDGRTHRISAYALMAGVHADSADDEAAREKLREFADKIGDLNALLGRQVADSEAFEPTRMRIFVSQASDDDQAEPAPNRIVWPLAGDPATAGQNSSVPGTRCVLATGPDLAAFLDAAKQATAITRWTYGSLEYSVIVRPLLPDEAGCGYDKLD